MKKIYLLLTLILLIGCEKEDTILPQSQDNLILQFQSQFNLAKYEDPFVRDNLKIRWNDFNKIEEKLESFEFSTNLNSTLRNSKNSIFTKYRLLGHRNNDELEFEVVKFISSENLDAITFKNFQNLGFSGTIIFRDLNGKPTKTEVYTDGLKSKKFNNFVNNNDSKTAPVDDCFDGCWIMMFTRPTIDYYQNSGAGGAWAYSYSRMGATTSEWIHVSGSGYTSNTSTDPYHNHYDYPSGPAVASDNHPVEILKDPSFIGTKAECVFDKLEELNGNLFKETIGTFIDDPKFNLIFKVDNCPNTNNACCDNTQIETSGDIFVIIEDINTNPIQLAQYILHESIHAEMARYVHQYNSGVDINDRPRLFQLYKYYHDIYDNDAGEIDHIYMTEKFITPIASTLRQLDGNRYSIDYYKAFAWDGLRIWDANGLLNMDPESPNFETYRVIVNQTSILCD